MTLLEYAERIRTDALSEIGYENLDVNEQFFTPSQVAELMANMLTKDSSFPTLVRLLDPGAGSGILTVAAVERIKTLFPETEIQITAVEKDPALLSSLNDTFSAIAQNFDGVTYQIINENFVYWATQGDTIFNTTVDPQKYDLIIQNPPYAKLPAKGAESVHLHKVGIHAPNIYAAFMALGERILAENGKMVSITPRSWMNGTYFTKFRDTLLHDSHLSAIHTFESRREVFKDTDVLQEAVITTVTRSRSKASEVEISISKSQAHDIATRTVPYSSVVVNGVIFVPATDEDADAVNWMSRARCQLEEIQVQVSTGRVVAFRNKQSLATSETENTVPMVYAENFRAGDLVHPAPKPKKPQFYHVTDTGTDKNLVPPGTFVLVKRFSAKEEKRRITAAIWSSDSSAAFDNKTNFFHVSGQGLPLNIAEGLCKWLNSSRVDRFFRVFSGHTQVNAGDLRMMPYPTLEQLQAIGRIDAAADASVDAVLG